MAEAILYGTAARFLGELASIPFEEIASAWNVKKDLRKLSATLSTIKSVLLDAEQQQRKNNEVKDWLGKLKHAFYELDNIIDDFVTEVLRRELRNDKSKIVEEVHDFFLPSKNKIVSSFKKSHRIKAIREELDEIASNRTKFHFKAGVEERTYEHSGREETHSYVNASNIIGRDKDKKEILELIIDNGASDNVSIIPIVGFGGLGKTTLAQLVYNDEMVQKSFELKMWVWVSEVFDLKLLVEKILKSADNECKDLEIDQLQSRLRKCLDGKKYILVLDDVWNENGEKWVKLKDLLMGGLQGSKIIATTRSKRVALIMGTGSPYNLKGLSKDDSWSLFKQLAFKRGQLEKNQNLEKIGIEILKRCGGVPLAIRTVGSLLSVEDTEVEWLIVKDELWEIAQDENFILPTLKVSYDHLSAHLRKCFAYCSMFPKDHKIGKATLIKLWIAHGFIQSTGEGCHLEDIGDQYFKDLLFRSFFQNVEKDDYGNIVSFGMHDLIHDLAQSVVGAECSITNASAKNISDETYHVTFDANLSSSWEVPTLLLKAKKIRTFFLCGERGPETRSTLDTLIASLRCLRVLDLHSSNIENLSSSISNLNHLRYLDLSWNIRLTTLPITICNMLNLQTLKLLYCYEFRELPVHIRKLVSLRHLEIDGCDQLNHMPSGLGELSSLQTLQLFVVGNQSSISKHIGGIGELNSLNTLRGKLAITCLENVRHDKSRSKELGKANLKAKQHLQILSLKWNQDDEGIVDNDVITAVLEDLQPHPNLKELNIEGYGGVSFPAWLTVNMAACLPNLVQITIDKCRKCQQLPSFGQLPFLKVLELKNLSSIDFIHNSTIEPSSSSSSSSLVCGSRDNLVGGMRIQSFFPSLEELYLYELPLFKEWRREVVMDDGDIDSAAHFLSFPCLSTLYIQRCASLTSIPLHPCLKQLQITYTCEKLLQSMTKLIETDCRIPRLASSVPFTPLSTLKTLSICFCEDLICLPEEGLRNLNSLQELKIMHCHNLVYLPEDGLRGLTSLQLLEIRFCNSLTSLSCGMKYLTALQELNISNCHAFNWLDEDDGFQGLVSLQSLDISMLSKLVRLPYGLQHVRTIQRLYITHCQDLVTLPGWIGYFTSLKKLNIGGCKNLETLPDTISCLTALRELDIINCDLLSERCQKEGGTEWYKIAHIPNVHIM